ncbi:MAG: hypothetical protein LBM28_03275 [Oscillospiraceae bacterium]|jgi:hypothetical protein|nr:hypothetical protein [Oscillospiraceae bacterium]
MSQYASLFHAFAAQGSLLQAPLDPAAEGKIQALHEEILKIAAESFILPFERSQALQISLCSMDVLTHLREVQARTQGLTLEHRSIAQLRRQLREALAQYAALLAALPQYREGKNLLMQAEQCRRACDFARNGKSPANRELLQAYKDGLFAVSQAARQIMLLASQSI